MRPPVRRAPLVILRLVHHLVVRLARLAHTFPGPLRAPLVLLVFMQLFLLLAVHGAPAVIRSLRLARVVAHQTALQVPTFWLQAVHACLAPLALFLIPGLSALFVLRARTHRLARLLAQPAPRVTSLGAARPRARFAVLVTTQRLVRLRAQLA